MFGRLRYYDTLSSGDNMNTFFKWVSSQKVWINILLSFLTCGIWIVVWIIASTKYKNVKISEEERKAKKAEARYQLEELIGAIILGLIFLVVMFFINK